MSKHTPGKWYFEGDGLTHRSFNIYVEQDGRRHVATVNNLPESVLKTRDAAEALANARLIANAPELYEALERLLAEYRKLLPEVVFDRGAAERAESALVRAGKGRA